MLAILSIVCVTVLVLCLMAASYFLKPYHVALSQMMLAFAACAVAVGVVGACLCLRGSE